jgi:DNA-directed RNA polymerase subunit RPC12/RpoP
LCGTEMSDRKSMNAHKLSAHRNEQSFHCGECPKKFQLNTSLQKHLAKRHEKEKETHRCDKCGKRFLKKVRVKTIFFN